MFEFMFAQMAKTKTHSCNGFDSSMIFTIKNIIEDSPDKFQEKLQTFQMLLSRLREKTNF